MNRDPNIVKAGFRTLEGGMDSNNRPNLIGENQHAYGVNVVVRGGYPTNRPGFVQIPLVFDTAANKSHFTTNHVQGAAYYRDLSGNHSIICVIAGKIYRIVPNERSGIKNVYLLSGTDSMNTTADRAWLCQAEQYMVIQTGVDVARIYNGVLARRANIGAPDFEVPTGTVMAYGQGRLFVVGPSKRGYYAGDLKGSGSEVIQFIENTELLIGGAIGAPTAGDITALTFVSSIDRSLGQGDLMVFTQDGVATARVSEDRQTWKNIEFQPVVLNGNGATGDRTVCLANGDIIYRSRDGVRSLALARRDFNSSWSSAPISGEMDRVLKVDSSSLLNYESAVIFDQRMIMAIWPHKNPSAYDDTMPDDVIERYGFTNKGLIALDFEPVGTIRNKAAPEWDGLWTGLNAWCLVAGEFVGEERCFAFQQNATFINELWEITKDADDDDGTAIPAVIESREFEYGTPFDIKKLDRGRVDIDSASGTVEFDVKYRSDNYPCWNDWQSWHICANTTQCENDPDGCGVAPNQTNKHIIHTYQKQRRTNMILSQPPDTDEESDAKPNRLGYSHQVRLAWTGKATIKVLVIAASNQPDIIVGPVAEDQECRDLECCEVDPDSYALTGDASIALA